MLLKPWVSVTFGTADIWTECASFLLFSVWSSRNHTCTANSKFSHYLTCFAVFFFFIYMMEIDSWTAHALNFGGILGSVFNQPTLSLLHIISRTFVNPPDVCKLFCSKLLESHTLHVCLCVCSLPHALPLELWCICWLEFWPHSAAVTSMRPGVMGVAQSPCII